MLRRKEVVLPRRLLLPPAAGAVWGGGVAHHGEGETGGNLQEDAMRVAYTVSEEWRVHIRSGSDQERTAVWRRQEALVQRVRRLELSESLSLSTIRSHLRQDLA